MVTASEFLKWLEVFNVQFGNVGPIHIPVSMAQGGTGSVLTATNNSLFYSTGSAGALLPTVANRAFMTDASGNIGWGTLFPQGISCYAPLTDGQLANKAYVDFSIGVLQGDAVLKSGSTMTGFLVLNANPASDNEAANKAYVDAVAAGLTPAGPVSAASTTDVPASYYNGVGNDGVGATLTMSPGVITLDGVATVLNGRYLFKDQSDATTDGIYDCTTEGDVSTQAVFTRATNYDTPTLINNTGIIPVISGSTQAGQGFYQINTIVTIGTTDFDYIKFGNAGTVTSVGSGAGLTGGPITGSGTLALAAIADANLLANISGGSLAPSATTLTALIDYAIGNTQGDVLYRNASGWVVLAPGTAGNFLATGGAAANPSWAAGNPGTVTSVGSGTGLTGGPITSSGSLALAAIADGDLLANISGGSLAPSAHTLSDVIDYAIGSTQGDVLYRNASGWVVLPPGTSGLALITGGAAANPAWGVSTLGSIADGDLLANISGISAPPIAHTLSDVIDYAIGNTQGDILYRNASGWVILAPGTAGQILSTGGAAANPSWIPDHVGTVTSVGSGTGLTGGPITSSGSLALAAIADADILANLSGGSAAPVPHTVSDVLDYAIGNTQGDILYRNASGWVVLAPGTAGNFLQTGGASANPAWAAGNAGTVTSVGSGTGLTGGPITGSGSLALAAIADGGLLANISGGSLAPSAHSLTSIIDYALGSTQGDILYRNGTVWTVLAPGTAGNVLATGGAAANPSWVAPGGSGTVTSVGSGTGLTGGPITSSGSLALAAIADANLLANLSGGSLAPSAHTLTSIIDYAIGSTQGDILYRNASGWVVLAPGTSGQALVTGGGAANPSWTVPALAAIADGDLLANTSGAPVAPVATTLTHLIDYAIGNTQGDILYRNSTNWVVLAPGTAGQVLQTGGAAANPSWVAVVSNDYTNSFLLMGG